MKKLFYFLVISIIAIGCSTSDNSNKTKVDFPVNPTNLAGIIVSSNQINLSWDDNSTNENGFKIERKATTTEYEVIGITNSNVHQFSDTNVIENTTYTYRVFSYNETGISTLASNVLTLTVVTVILPTLTTTSVSEITNGTAVSGGTISNDGVSLVTARGIVWSTSPNPAITLPTKTNDGIGAGAFTSYMTGLISNITYHVRAYITNGFETSYGNEFSFTTSNTIPVYNISGPSVTDVEGNVIQSVINCSQIWITRNLNVSTYDDGTPIPQVTDPIQWANLTTGAWCYYNNDPINGLLYGKLYNWYAVVGIYDSDSFLNLSLRKKLAPSGWHIATNSEWNSLGSCLGGNQFAGGKMKSTGTEFWQNPNDSASNLSGFSGLPGGFRNMNGNFNNIGTSGCWWSSSPMNIDFAGMYSVDYFGSVLSGNDFRKEHGFSVRCIKD